MKKNILPLVVLISLLGACGSKNESNNATSSTNNTAAVASSKFIDKKILGYDKDPVCLMPINDEMEDSTIHNGIVYGFCCAGCKKEFVIDPASYIVKK